MDRAGISTDGQLRARWHLRAVARMLDGIYAPQPRDGSYAPQPRDGSYAPQR